MHSSGRRLEQTIKTENLNNIMPILNGRINTYTHSYGVLAKLSTDRADKLKGVYDETATPAKWLSRNHLKSH